MAICVDIPAYDSISSIYGYKAIEGPDNGNEKRIDDKLYLIVKHNKEWVSFYTPAHSNMVDDLTRKLKPYAKGLLRKESGFVRMYVYRAHGKLYQVELQDRDPRYIVVTISHVIEEFHTDELIER